MADRLFLLNSMKTSNLKMGSPAWWLFFCISINKIFIILLYSWSNKNTSLDILFETFPLFETMEHFEMTNNCKQYECPLSRMVNFVKLFIEWQIFSPLTQTCQSGGPIACSVKLRLPYRISKLFDLTTDKFLTDFDIKGLLNRKK